MQPKSVTPAPVLGVDLSAYQPPAAVQWDRLRELGYSFAYVRGVRTGDQIDVHCVEHVERARAAGFRVGLYSFFVPGIDATSQVSTYLGAHHACGMRPGDLAPALDLESHSGAPASPAWVEPAAEILARWRELFGAAVRYHNVTDWHAIGCPEALTAYPLWLADYTPPADLPCVIWQQRSGKIAGYGSAVLDQNAALGDLPVIGATQPEPAHVEPSSLAQEIAIPWPQWDRDAHDRLKTEAVARNTEREP